MGLFFLPRYGIAVFAFIGWIFYQKYAKRKSWGELKPDAIAIAFFFAVWVGISYWVMS